MRLSAKLRYLYLAYFSKPVGDRAIYRTIKASKPRKILEIGLGNTVRSLRMIELAQQAQPALPQAQPALPQAQPALPQAKPAETPVAAEPLRYAAIDLFEGRPATAPGMSLKDAHKIFKATGATVQLIPGDPASALARVANSMPNVDLVLISAEHDEAALENAWFFLPRMLHASSQVLMETVAEGVTTFKPITAVEIQAKANSGRRRRAA